MPTIYYLPLCYLRISSYHYDCGGVWKGMVEGDGGLDVELEAEGKMVEKGRDGGVI